MHLAIIIPAAGASTRMRGRDKLLEEVDGVPLLRRQVLRALETGWPVVVSLRADRPERADVLEGLEIETVVVRNPDAGMAGSLRHAMDKIGDKTHGVMIVPADMPDLNTVDFLNLARRFECKISKVIRGAAANGQPGHPVIFPQRLFEALRSLPDGEGAKAALVDEPVTLCPLPAEHAITDLDTPEDWALWRASRGGSGGEA